MNELKRGAFSLGRGIAMSTRQGLPCRRSHLLANPAEGLPLADGVDREEFLIVAASLTHNNY